VQGRIQEGQGKIADAKLRIKGLLGWRAAADAKKGSSDAVVTRLVVSCWCNSLGVNHSAIRTHVGYAAARV
jgi:hypothetical protein